MPRKALAFCPQLSLAGTAPSIIFVATNVLSRETRVCHDKSKDVKFCRDKHTFVATKEVYFCFRVSLGQNSTVQPEAGETVPTQALFQHTDIIMCTYIHMQCPPPHPPNLRSCHRVSGLVRRSGTGAAVCGCHWLVFTTE